MNALLQQLPVLVGILGGLVAALGTVWIGWMTQRTTRNEQTIKIEEPANDVLIQVEAKSLDSADAILQNVLDSLRKQGETENPISIQIKVQVKKSKRKSSTNQITESSSAKENG